MREVIDVATSNTDPKETRETLTRYDLLLLVIPTVFLAALLGSYVSSWSPSTLLAAAAVVASVAVADGLFVNPPTGPERP
jgi:uncharacterized membrane protein SpoIIM required for sporulation